MEIPLSSVDAPESSPSDSGAAAEEPEAPRDVVREAVLGRIKEELGAAVVGSHIRAGDDLWVRVTREAWPAAAELLSKKLKYSFFDFLSGLDWMPSPFGRDMDSQEDILVNATESKALPEMAQGYAGGDTRFQVFGRVYSLTDHMGITLKADLPDDDLSVGTWVGTFAGANWHERECWEMFGFTFTGHPQLTHLYLPGGFEGNPLRKDFPLLARRVKPWPGIVDVEPMPGGAGGDDEEGGE